jgi:hypothetical protein
MDFTKFMALLETRTLYFCRSDLLSDPWEGLLPRRTVQSLRAPMGQSSLSDPALNPALDLFKKVRKIMYINCWHSNQHESAAMWKIYLKSDEGIAVRTTFDRLARCLDRNDKLNQVSVGSVSYIDYDNAEIPINNAYFPFLSKRISFAHEREVRAIIMLPAANEAAGLNISVDLDALIEEVVLAPFSPNWIRELIAAVLQRYGLHAPLVQSRLGENPLY